MNASEEQIQLARCYGITCSRGGLLLYDRTIEVIKQQKESKESIEAVPALNCIRALDLPSITNTNMTRGLLTN